MRKSLAAIFAVSASLALAAPTLAAPSPAALSGDPATLVVQLREMGYAPELIEDPSGPTITIKADEATYVAALGGCTDNKACDYLVLLGSFTDVLNPPVDWVAERNINYDRIKVWVNNAHELTYSSTVPINGLPRALFENTVEQFLLSKTELAEDANKAGLITPQ